MGQANAAAPGGNAAGDAATGPICSEDGLLGGRIRLRQPVKGPRAGDDSLLLAAAVPARAGDRVAELGCGTGPALLALAVRVDGVGGVGYEIDPDLADLARANIAANGFAGRLDCRTVDIADLPGDDSAAEGVDHVFLNPPYFTPGRHAAAPDRRRGRARREAPDRPLSVWIGAALAMLRPGGSVTIIQAADRLPDILAALGGGAAGDIRLFPLWSRPGSEAKRVIVQATKKARGPLVLLPGLVLHDLAGGGYGAAAEAVLRHGAALSLTTP